MWMLHTHIQLRQYQFLQSTSELFQHHVCQHNLLSGKEDQSNNHIPPLVLSFSYSQFLEGSIQRPWTILPYPERLQTHASSYQWLRTGRPGFSLGNTISHGAQPPSHSTSFWWPASPMTSSIHTISPLPCKTAASSPVLHHLTSQPKRGPPPPCSPALSHSY